MQAANLRRVDADYRNHLQAFLNFVVKAEKRTGKSSKPVYRTFSDFYNYESEIDKATGKEKEKAKSRFSGIGKYLKKGE